MYSAEKCERDYAREWYMWWIAIKSGVAQQTVQTGKNVRGYNNYNL